MASRAAASSSRCVSRASSAFFSPAVFIAFGTVRHSARTASSAAAMMSRRFLGSTGFPAFLFSSAGFAGAVFFFRSTAGFGGFFSSCSFTGFSFFSRLGGFTGFGGFAFFFPLRLPASPAIVCVLSAGLSARPRSSAFSCAGVIFAPSFDGGSSVSSISLSVEAGGVLPVMSLYIVALMA